uniref:Uncharacterized protein n=1 Tax=Lepeophtheirus salmonis TaxID=72036 RepID=A0A0K2UFR2_LEPSM
MCRTVCSTGPHMASTTHLHIRTSSTPVSFSLDKAPIFQ